MIIKNLIRKSTSHNPDNASTIYCFFKTGICILSTVCLTSLAIAFVISSKNSNNLSRQAMTSIISEKKLPIYCVDTNKPKIALSFDAAWGDILLMYF